MNLKKITINNYRSIEKLEINFDGQNRGFFGFLGINEAGKSNLLKAISLKDNLSEFNYENSRRKEVEENVEVIYDFDWTFSNEEIKEMLIKGRTQINLPDNFTKHIKIQGFSIKSFIEKGKAPANKVQFKLRDKEIIGWSRDPSNLVKEDTEGKLDIGLLLNEQLSEKILKDSPKVIFWKSEDKYLMGNTVNLSQFKSNPSNISIPLKNCFILSGYEKILETIDKSNADFGFRGDLYEEISKRVTEFVNKKWVDHKVELKFEESGGSLNFFIKDIDGKRQIVSSRSDGFRQFISFLLSSSAEVESGEVKNSVILIDEPETHLHPTSQLDLLNEFIKISKKNILLFATHSSYLIDKSNFSDYYNIFKKDNLTNFEKFENTSTTFSEINYIVFGIPTTDYHNELYGWCEENKKTDLNSLPQNKSYVRQNLDGTQGRTETISLQEYIRHQIHHPENNRNPKFSEKDLLKSIKALRKIKYGE